MGDQGVSGNLPAGRSVRVVVLTGAGISAESGLPTFRGVGGIWEGRRAEDVATPEAFRRDPAMVWRFYNARRRMLDTVQPNPAHHALAVLENYQEPERFTLITQNVDDLHQRAGSLSLIPMHGELRKVRCTGCGMIEARPEELEELPRCSCGALLRPHVVWFGEVPLELDRIARVLRRAQVFLVIGTSGHVYPAAAFIHDARAAGASTVGVNIQEPEVDWVYDEFHLGKAGEVIPALVERWTHCPDEDGPTPAVPPSHTDSNERPDRTLNPGTSP
ncbi:NAD-dependent deacylase [Candidatus Fermentibacteria bacterium]|nr:NAD-dependent deacylase [Candidatus Fermentibacteria bacterium]